MTRKAGRKSIQGRISTATLAICVAVILGVSAGFVGYETAGFRSELYRERVEVAQVVASGVAAAVAFEDQVAMDETLAALSQLGDARSATIRAADGRMLASIGQESGAGAADALDASQLGRLDLKNAIVARVPITVDDELLGTLRLEVGTDALNAGRAEYLRIGLIALAFASLAAWITSRLVARVIARPIHALSEVMMAVREEGDYSRRADASTRDEVGALADSFNAMIAEVRRRDETIEETVRERTAELEATTAKAEAASRA